MGFWSKEWQSELLHRVRCSCVEASPILSDNDQFHLVIIGQ
jgi:hypothetical protein